MSDDNNQHDTQQPQSNEQNTPNSIAEATQSPLEQAQAELDPTNEQKVIPNEIDLEQLNSRIQELEAEVKETKARANADMYNTQKRAENEAEKTKKFALEKFARDLLDVIDNLERAIDNATEGDPVAEGVKLTHKSLLKVFETHNITPIHPANGDAFNADWHEAVGVDPEAKPDTIGKVLQKGYQLNERLLRPAMVQVGQ